METKTKTPEQQEKYARLVPEVFVHDRAHPERTEEVVDAMIAIEKIRFGDQAFTRDVFEDELINTVKTRGNKGRTTTVVVVRDPKDNSIFGFTIADPADYIYQYESQERLDNPNIRETAYINDTVFRESGTGVIKRLMPVLERELYSKGYRYLERDAAMANNYAPNIVKNNRDRVLYTHEHDSVFGPQMYIRMTITPPQC